MANKPHEHADLLMAIAEGKQMRRYWPEGYVDISADEALRRIADGDGEHIRIKPREPRRLLFLERDVHPEHNADVRKYADEHGIAYVEFVEVLP